MCSWTTSDTHIQICIYKPTSTAHTHRIPNEYDKTSKLLANPVSLTHTFMHSVCISKPSLGSMPLITLPIGVLIVVVDNSGACLYKADCSTNRTSDTSSPSRTGRESGSHSALHYIFRYSDRKYKYRDDV